MENTLEGLKTYLEEYSDYLNKVDSSTWLGMIGGMKFRFFIDPRGDDHWVGVRGPEARRRKWPAFYNAQDLDAYLDDKIKMKTLSIKHKL